MTKESKSEICFSIEADFARKLEEILIPRGLTIEKALQIFIQEIIRTEKAPDFIIEAAKNEPQKPNPDDYLGQKRKFNDDNQAFIIESIESFFIAADKDDAIMNIKILATDERKTMELGEILLHLSE